MRLRHWSLPVLLVVACGRAHKQRSNTGRLLVPSARPSRAFATESVWDELIAAGILHPPVETGDPFEDWPDIRLPAGTAAKLIDADRGEA
jgi:hypothetical protein